MKEIFTKIKKGASGVWGFLSHNVPVPLSLVYVVAFVVLFALISFHDYSDRRDEEMQRLQSYYRDRFTESVEDVRTQLVEGLFTADSTASRIALTEEDRIRIYMREATAFILQHRGSANLSETDRNEMLLRNYDYSQRYGIHPGLFLAFASAESSFDPLAVSSANARGIVQFMPATAAITMGSDYYDGIEFNPVLSVSMWYRYVSYFLNQFDGDIQWTAASYLSPHAVRWYERGESVEDFLNWVASWSDNPPTYSQRVVERFAAVRSRIYQAYMQE